MGNYEFEFTEHGPYGAALRLLAGVDLRDKVVLDVGCGAASIADPLRDRGATYIGLDVDEDVVAKLVLRGFEGRVVDLGVGDLTETFGQIVRGRDVAAFLCLDVLEHVVEPASVLAGLATLGSDTELVVSIPNVGHLDLAAQLLSGNWTMTDSGLLDRTHVRFFTHRSLTELMTSNGWHEAAREDFLLPRSDQNVAEHPAFEANTNLGKSLRALRFGVDEFGHVNQFVRRYHRGARRHVERAEPERPFLSVVIRTQGQRPGPLTEVLCCLAAQTDLDFEIVLVVHDSTKVRATQELVDCFDGNLVQHTHVVGVDGGTRSAPANAGLDRATGRYVVFLDDDDLVTANWVENIRAGADRRPGAVIRWWAAEQRRAWGEPGDLAAHPAVGPLTPTYAKPFDFVTHVRRNETPFHCFAVPRALIDLGLRFNEALTVCEDWDFLMRASMLCGVHDTEEMTSIYNKWSSKNSSHAVVADEWSVMRSLIHVRLDEQPLVLPPGSARRIDELLYEREKDQGRIGELQAQLAATLHEYHQLQQVSNNAHHALTELRRSTSWRISAPVRWIGKLARLARGKRS